MLCVLHENGKKTFPCGQCTGCKVNARRKKVGRLVMEWSTADTSSFLTLTYARDPWELQPYDLTCFLKRLRHVARFPLKYFAVGEYGTKLGRPHYHVCLFHGDEPMDQERIEPIWGHGFVTSSELHLQRMSYCAQYAMKKMTKETDPRLEGRRPEFTRQSKTPPLGSEFIDDVVAGYMTQHGSAYLAKHGDIATEVQIGRQYFPMDQYTKTKIRAALGLPKYACERVPPEGFVEPKARIKPTPAATRARTHRINRASRNHGTL